MKNIISILIFGLSGLIVSCGSENVEKLPALTMLLTDSATVVNTNNISDGEPTILMYFSPDCEHCHATTQEIIKKIDSLKNVHIYLLTPMPFSELRGFYQLYHLDKYKNITVGNDYQFTFYRAFKPVTVPYIVIYDKNKNLLKIYNKNIKVSTIIKTVYQES